MYMCTLCVMYNIVIICTQPLIYYQAVPGIFHFHNTRSMFVHKNRLVLAYRLPNNARLLQCINYATRYP